MGRERERGGEIEIKRERHTHTHTQTQRERERGGDRDKERETHIHTQTEREGEGGRERERDRGGEIEIRRERDTHTHTQTERGGQHKRASDQFHTCKQLSTHKQVYLIKLLQWIQCQEYVLIVASLYFNAKNINFAVQITSVSSFTVTVKPVSRSHGVLQ